jgi:hypothetical protein
LSEDGGERPGESYLDEGRGRTGGRQEEEIPRQTIVSNSIVKEVFINYGNDFVGIHTYDRIPKIIR